MRTARRAGSLRQVLLALGAKRNDLEKLAILNGRHLNDRVSAKTMVKIIEHGVGS